MARESVWEKARSDLLLFLQKEVGVMRELLANMHQEEFILLNRDKEGWNRVMQERAQMIQSLSSLRENRLEASKRLEEIAIVHKKVFSLENLASEDAENCEFISLCDQIKALLDKMNLQKNRNANLLKEWNARQNLPPGQRVVPFAQPQVKAKISIATQEPPLHKDEENLGS